MGCISRQYNRIANRFYLLIRKWITNLKADGDLKFSVKMKNNAKNFQVTGRISGQYNRIANKFVNKKGEKLIKSWRQLYNGGDLSFLVKIKNNLKKFQIVVCISHQYCDFSTRKLQCSKLPTRWYIRYLNRFALLEILQWRSRSAS